MPRRPTEPRLLVCNPATDREFVSSAASLAEHEPSVDSFEAALRSRYPAARARDGTLSDEAERWYIYRDGRWAGTDSNMAHVEVRHPVRRRHISSP